MVHPHGLITTGGGPAVGNLFEEMKQVNEHGAEYWNARDIMSQLGYKQWRRFESAIAKATTSCAQSGNDPDFHFASAGKSVRSGSGSVRSVTDYHLSRFACYLIAQNGDSRKSEIALAQQYFAIQTRRQELSDQAIADQERLGHREEAKREHKELSGAARQAGVQNHMFGVFHDAGYKGLYKGLGKESIKHRKGIPDKDELMDRMNSNELAMNNLVKTQTKEQLASVNNQGAAIATHQRVGERIRQAIREIGGTMPEDIEPAEHIRVVQKRIKTTAPKLELESTDAQGLVGPHRAVTDADLDQL